MMNKKAVKRTLGEETRFDLEQRLRLAFDTNMAGIVITNLSSRVLDVNASFCNMLGYAREEILSNDLKKFTPAEDRAITVHANEGLLSGSSEQVIYSKRYQHRDGSLVWFEISKSVGRDPKGRPKYFVASVRNITAERLLLAQLTEQALHDPLTGVANRLLFEDRLIQVRAKARRAGGWLAVFLIDLDDFKDVNDTLGHQVGDELLKAVSKRLQQIARSEDTLCRFGGDEFLYLTGPFASRKEVTKIADRLLSVFDEPFALGEESFSQFASIGIVTQRGGNDDVDLVRDADTALAEAKRQGGERYVLFHPEMHYRVSNRLSLVQDLRRSLESDELQMHYQPVMNLITNKIVGIEALMRWSHPRNGFVSPDIFIPLVERSRFIFDLGSFAIKRAVSEAAAVSKLHDAAHLSVGVNLSPRQFYDPHLIRIIEEACGDNDFQPSRLVLEITEDAAFEDINKAAKIASRLTDLGVVLAIDDFGTGYSALSHFALLQPRIIKIDKSLVQAANTLPSGERLLAAMATIGNSLDAAVIAEGIESVVHLEMLRELGYIYGQGYVFSPAVASVDLANLLANGLTLAPCRDVSPTELGIEQSTSVIQGSKMRCKRALPNQL